jgi:uncharacterized protein (TIGR02466 family)
MLPPCWCASITGTTPQVHEMWSTPIFTQNLDNAESLNAALLREAERLRAISPAGGRARSNRGGWRSVGSDLHERADMVAFTALRGQVEVAIEAAWRSRLPPGQRSGRYPLFMSEMWMIMLGSGDSLGVHKHANAMLAGVYWVNTPTVLLGGASLPSAGALKLRDPRPQTSVYESLEWSGLGSETQLNPRAGMLACWPAWLEHYVEPLPIVAAGAATAAGAVDSRGRSSPQATPTADLRIAIAFNFQIERPERTGTPVPPPTPPVPPPTPPVPTPTPRSSRPAASPSSPSSSPSPSPVDAAAWQPLHARGEPAERLESRLGCVVGDAARAPLERPLSLGSYCKAIAPAGSACAFEMLHGGSGGRGALPARLLASELGCWRRCLFDTPDLIVFMVADGQESDTKAADGGANAHAHLVPLTRSGYRDTPFLDKRALQHSALPGCQYALRVEEFAAARRRRQRRRRRRGRHRKGPRCHRRHCRSCRRLRWRRRPHLRRRPRCR